MKAAAAQTRQPAPKPSLRDRAMRCAVRELFSDRYEVTNRDNGHRHTVAATWLDGEVVTVCRCKDKVFNRAPVCRHEYVVKMFKRSRAAARQFGE